MLVNELIEAIKLNTVEIKEIFEKGGFVEVTFRNAKGHLLIREYATKRFKLLFLKGLDYSFRDHKFYHNNLQNENKHFCLFTRCNEKQKQA
jgi:hypothetical protein